MCECLWSNCDLDRGRIEVTTTGQLCHIQSLRNGGLSYLEPLNWQIVKTLSNWKAQVVKLKKSKMALAVEHGDQLASKSHNNLTYNMDYHKSYQHLLHLSGHPLNEAPSPPVASSSNGRSASPNLPPADNADSKVHPDKLNQSIQSVIFNFYWNTRKSLLKWRKEPAFLETISNIFFSGRHSYPEKTKSRWNTNQMIYKNIWNNAPE